MSNIITLYAGVPTSATYKNVVVFQTETARKNALTKYKVVEYSGADTAPFFETQVFLNIPANVTNARNINYMRVEYDTGEIFYYFVADVKRVQGQNRAGAFRLSIAPDIFQSYFFRGTSSGTLANAPQLLKTTIKRTNIPALIPSGYSVELPAEAPNISYKTSGETQTKSVFGTVPQQVTIVAVYQTPDELLTLGKTVSKSLMTSYINILTAATKIKITPTGATTSKEINITPVKCYAVPTALIKPNPSQLNSYQIYQSGSYNETVYTLIGATISKDMLLDSEDLKTGVPYIGTAQTRVKPYIRASYNGTISATVTVSVFAFITVGGIQILLIDQLNNGAFIDITADFETPVIYSTAAQYFAQNGVSKAISMVGSGVSLAAGIATGNPFAIAQGTLGAVGQVADVAQQINAPATVKTASADGVVNMLYTNHEGILLFLTPVNVPFWNYGEEYGFAVNYLQDVVLTSSLRNGGYIAATVENVTGVPPALENDFIAYFNSGIRFKDEY